MNKRIQRLRQLSFETDPSISIERAIHQTQYYNENYGKYTIPVLRALSFLDHCRKKQFT
jgi:trans-4-hydroxy-L-proline dehydratase